MTSPRFMASKASLISSSLMRRVIMRVEVELAVLPEAQELVEVGAHVGGAVVRADEVLLGEEQLEGREVHELVELADAHDAGRAAAADGVVGGPHGDGEADGLEGVVEAVAAGEAGLQAVDLVGLAGVGGAEGAWPSSSFPSFRSTATITEAPATLAPMMQEMPTPPQP